MEDVLTKQIRSGNLTQVGHNFTKSTKELDITTIHHLEINPESTISNDIVDIWHDAASSDICIRLREGARCPHPSLVGRLSGKTVVMLNWSLIQDDSLDTTYCGSYSDAWVDAGLYFVELIIMHCNNFGVLALQRKDVNWDDWLSYNYIDESLEDIFHDILVSNSTYVSIDLDHVGVGDLTKGRWMLSNNMTNYSEYVPEPWFARRQPQNCVPPSEDGGTIRCTAPMNNSHIEEYEFSWSKSESSWNKDLEQLQVDLGKELQVKVGWPLEVFNTVVEMVHGIPGNESMNGIDVAANVSKICLLGDSHSFYMLQTLYTFHLGHRFILINVFWTNPKNLLDAIRFGHGVYNCTKFVIGVGTWPASHQAALLLGGPVLFKQFYDDIRAIANNSAIYALGEDVKIYLRNMYHVPLSQATSYCKTMGEGTKDWRTHTVIDGYNYLSKKIVDEV